MNGAYVWFEYKGSRYQGYLESVCGAGANVYHLMVNRFYWGRLRLDAFGEWVLDTNQKGLEDLAGEFGYWVSTSFDLRFTSNY